ncbi:MAG: adenylyltransferase, partial [Clostridia bacterium]|nr:adenylyltransferase [Clostridia bacterium]
AVKYLSGAGELLTGQLLTYDALTNDFRKVKLPSHVADCPVCGDHPTITAPVDYEQPACELKGGTT